ncbi:MAG TPA: hypothetical protein VMA83_03230 [Solirubrobacteraceae bacterium]|nr:hypothetical protein [Solirubrobacteraceae bacterium]
MTRRLLAPPAALFALAVLACLAPAAGARKASEPKPSCSTGGVRYLEASSAQLTGVVQPNGVPTSYYFAWGTSSAGLNRETNITPVGNQVTKISVGQTITGLTPGTVYYYRIVALAEKKTYDGQIRSFTAKGSELKFTIAKRISVPVGASFTYSGTLSGTGSAGATVELQETTYPYSGVPTELGATTTTSSTGHFAFPVHDVARNIELRVEVLTKRPIYSSFSVVHATVHVSLKTRTRSGVTRAYGTVLPAVNSTEIEIQQEKTVRSGRRAGSVTWVTVAVAHAKPAAVGSRYSAVFRVPRTGRYRAYARITSGPYSAGESAWVHLTAAPRHTRHHHH